MIGVPKERGLFGRFPFIIRNSNLLVEFVSELLVSAMVSSVHCVHGFAVVGGRVLGFGVEGAAVVGA